MKYPLIQAKTAVVTGSSTGIGRATARMLKADGWRVLGTVRKQPDADALQEEGIEPLMMDAADTASVARAADQVRTRCRDGLGALVNNAGIGLTGAMEDFQRDDFRRQFEINVFGMQEFTNLLLPAFLDQRRGRIVYMSSILGKVAIPFTGLYAASKFAMEGMADALRVELTGTGVAVSIVEPGPIESEFRRTAVREALSSVLERDSRFSAVYDREIRRREDAPQSEKAFMLPPEAVARKVRHALTSPRPRIRYPVTVPAHAGVFLKRVLPDRVVDAILARPVKKMLRQGGMCGK